MKKLREPINTGKYDEDVAKYIPGLLELKFQGMLEDIDTSEKVAHSSYTDMEELDFQILLTDNYYINPNSIHICFPIKLKKKQWGCWYWCWSDNSEQFFCTFCQRISMSKYGSNIFSLENIPILCWYAETSPKRCLKRIEKNIAL